MAVEFKQAGKQINVTLAADTNYHAAVAVGSLIAITRASGKSGETVACDVEGVYEFAKASGSALNQGTPVTITVATNTAAATAGGSTSNGVVWETAASSATSVLVKINERVAVASA